MIRRLVFLSFSFLLLAIACLGPLPQNMGSAPIVRIGLIQNVAEVRFQTPEKLSLRHPNGRLIAADVAGKRWRVVIKQIEPARIEYRLLVISTKDKAEAKAVLNQVIDAGLLADMIEERPDYDRLWVAQNATNIYKVVLREKFPTREAALARQKETAAKIQSELWEAIKRAAGGALELKNLDNNKTYQLPSSVQVIADRMGISAVEVGAGFHWANSENRVYSNRLEFFIDRFSKMTVVNILPIENYVAGVVPSEMSSAFPVEALKAQAVAARNEIISKIGTRHLEDGFDLCADVHCQVYGGVNRQRESTDRAVKETSGLVMKSNGAVIEASYAGVCGGHTESNENVWNGLPKPYLRGIFDGKGRSDLLKNSLTNENALRKWVTAKPIVYCNTTQGQVPAALEYTKKFFRWEIDYTRQELQAMIRKRTGEDFGDLQDLVPLLRGPSGRLIRLRVVGSKKNLEINRELTIRQALAEKTLWSACIVFEKSGMDRDRLPVKFKILGAGWGHGVGLCQTGAAMMALRGQNFEQILRHYYSNVKLDKEY